MAIPHWTWPSEDDPDFDAASDAFDALSDPTRAAVVDAVRAADGPVAYSALQDAVDAPDNGRLNYHLRQLDDALERGEDGYRLTEHGQQLADALAAATRR